MTPTLARARRWAWGVVALAMGLMLIAAIAMMGLTISAWLSR